MLDVRRLRVLSEVSAAGSVSRAAANLNYTHSAVSQQLSTLERETGTKLLERDGRGVRLTHAAHVLVAHTRTVLAQLEAAEAALAATRGTIAGEVSLGSFATANATLVPGVLTVLRERYPDLHVRLLEMEPHESLPALRQRQIDLALTYRYDLVAPDDASDLEEVELLTEPVLLVRRADGSAPGPVRLGDYAGVPWIVPHSETTCGVMTRRACAASGFEPDAVAEARDFATAVALAAGGVGVALVPELGYRPQDGLEAAPVVEPRLTRRVAAAARAGSGSHPAHAAVLEELTAQGDRAAIGSPA
jgi:DNA-binding transcriptional LysR family regulator